MDYPSDGMSGPYPLGYSPPAERDADVTAAAVRVGAKNGVGARHQRAEEEGAEAFRRGVPFEANPYPDTGGMAYKSEWAFWQGGWRKAEYAAHRKGAK